MDIYVGNLPYQAEDMELENLFAAHGNVDSVKIIMDRETGRSKGFGFVTMSNEDEAKAAIQTLEGAEFLGRNLKVNEARPREDRPQKRNRY